MNKLLVAKLQAMLTEARAGKLDGMIASTWGKNDDDFIIERGHATKHELALSAAMLMGAVNEAVGIKRAG